MGEVAETVQMFGGVLTRRELVRVHGRVDVDRALRAGVLARVARGRYVLPGTAAHLATAHARTSTLSHLSAALHHGWKVKVVPDDAWVTVRRKRHLRETDLVGIVPHWAEIAPADVRAGVTGPMRTVLDCARCLPFDEALAVADSALRAGHVDAGALGLAAAGLRGAGARAARRVAAHADSRAANPLESVLRALCIEEGFSLEPQLKIAEPGLFAVVDLGSEELMLAVEADGFEHHGTRSALRTACRRHTELAVFGWSSLRFPYEDVMHHQDWVRWTLRTWRSIRTDGSAAGPPPSSRVRRQAVST